MMVTLLSLLEKFLNLFGTYPNNFLSLHWMKSFTFIDFIDCDDFVDYIISVNAHDRKQSSLAPYAQYLAGVTEQVSHFFQQRPDIFWKTKSLSGERGTLPFLAVGPDSLSWADIYRDTCSHCMQAFRYTPSHPSPKGIIFNCEVFSRPLVGNSNLRWFLIRREGVSAPYLGISQEFFQTYAQIVTNHLFRPMIMFYERYCDIFLKKVQACHPQLGWYSMYIKSTEIYNKVPSYVEFIDVMRGSGGHLWYDHFAKNVSFIHSIGFNASGDPYGDPYGGPFFLVLPTDGQGPSIIIVKKLAYTIRTYNYF